MSRPEIKPGQKFWMVRNWNGRDPIAEQVTVKSVGRRWAKLNNGYRFDLLSEDWRDLDGEGYSSPGFLWDSREDYLAFMLKKTILSSIRERLGKVHRRMLLPPVRDVLQFARLLGIPDSEYKQYLDETGESDDR